MSSYGAVLTCFVAAVFGAGLMYFVGPHTVSATQVNGTTTVTESHTEWGRPINNVFYNISNGLNQ